jgi:hypothetical protein
MGHWWVFNHSSPGNKKNPRNFIRHDFLFPFNQAMNILGGHESYNTPAKK